MTQAEWLLHYNWMIALTVAVGVISWVVLILQAVFNDKRIALIGVFGGLLFSFTFLFPSIIPLLIKYSATALCVLFFVCFVIKNYRQAAVYLSATGVLLSSACGYWLYQSYQLARII